MARKDRLLRQYERTRYLVTLRGGEAIYGVLIDWDEAHLVLADAEDIAPNGDRRGIDGEIWLPRQEIKYMNNAGQ